MYFAGRLVVYHGLKKLSAYIHELPLHTRGTVLTCMEISQMCTHNYTQLCLARFMSTGLERFLPPPQNLNFRWGENLQLR